MPPVARRRRRASDVSSGVRHDWTPAVGARDEGPEGHRSGSAPGGSGAGRPGGGSQPGGVIGGLSGAVRPGVGAAPGVIGGATAASARPAARPARAPCRRRHARWGRSRGTVGRSSGWRPGGRAERRGAGWSTVGSGTGWSTVGTGTRWSTVRTGTRWSTVRTGARWSTDGPAPGGARRPVPGGIQVGAAIAICVRRQRLRRTRPTTSTMTPTSAADRTEQQGEADVGQRRGRARAGPLDTARTIVGPARCRRWWRCCRTPPQPPRRSRSGVPREVPPSTSRRCWSG